MFFELFSFSVDFGSSVVDPNQVFLGNLDFFLNVFSVGGGIISGSFVGIGNESQVSDLFSEDSFVGGINFVVFVLGVNVLLFKRV